MKLNKRYAQKLKTRTILLQSALHLMGNEKSLGSLSLREVAAEAGIVPAAFYRHFKDMEELGLALVDEVSLKLRTILREARKRGVYKTAPRKSLEMFFNYVKSNHLIFSFIIREQVGESRRIRQSIRNEMNFISTELSNDMKRGNSSIPQTELEFIASFIVSTCFHQAADFLDSDLNDLTKQNNIKITTLKQLRLIYSGLNLLNKKLKKIKTIS
jgi:AcrR family transcriptional regulator